MVSRAALPDWLVIGAPKCGTTSVARWLGDHPNAFVSAQKELSFFDAGWDEGLGWYAQQFIERRPGQRAGEATPEYMYSDAALDRIRDTIPDVRLILILREPVSRLWSQSWFLRSIGADPRSLQRAVAAQRRTGRPGFGLSVGYLESSRYAPRVRALYERFPREQVLVELFDDLRAEPAAVWGRICTHIGIDASVHTPDLNRSVNPGRAPRSSWLQWATTVAYRHHGPERALRRIRSWNASRPYPDMPEQLRRRLRAEFARDLAELAHLLERPLPAGWTEE